MKLDSKEDKAWYKAFRAVHQDFYEFIKSQYPKVLKWAGAEKDSVGYYKKALGGEIKVAEPVAAPVPVTKPAAGGSAAKKAPAVKKDPVKVLKLKTWECSYFVGETITFEESEVDPNMTFNFFNCEKCTIVIKGKFKGSMFMRCKKIDLKLDECISVLEVIRCEDMKIRPEQKVPQINVEHTQAC